MRQKYWTRLSRVFVVLAVIGVVCSIPTIASASCITSQQSCTTKYGVSQTQFSSGSNYDQCSTGPTGYCANASVGDLGDGGGTGPNNNYKSQSGSGLTVNRDAYIQFSVGGVSTDLGYLTPSGTKSLVANFTVKTYQASGYIVMVNAPPPTDNAPGHHILSVPASPATSGIGTEQFGINLVANTTPPALGTPPFCTPDSTFCPTGALTSAITSHYNQANKFYYPGSGANYTDTLVNSNTSTGSVSYTVSFIYNISPTTPDGQYTYNGMFIATSTY